MDVLHKDIEVYFVLKCLDKPDDIWKNGLFEDGPFIYHRRLQSLPTNDLFRYDLQGIEVVTVLVIFDQ
jgi:hypothetical protein